MVSGDGGIGKSLLMQQLLTSACLGKPWLGLSCTPGRGLFLACEDDEDELHRRQWAINRSLNREMTDVIEAGLHVVARVGQDNALVRLDRSVWKMEPTELFKRLLAWCLQHGITYVVIDTATQTFAGNQNDEQQVVQFINMLRRLAIAIQGIVIITKHPSLTGRSSGTGESGNTAWNNSVRSRLYVYERVADQVTELRGMKANYGRKLEKIELQWSHGCFEVKPPAEPMRRYGYDD
jgi:RecA-family ATPase